MTTTQTQDPTLEALIAQRARFLRFLERRVPSPALAEDILQAAYLRALQRSSDLRANESATAWFFRILRNAVIDFFRHRAVEDRALTEWALELETITAPADLTLDIVCQCILAVLPALKPTYAEAIREIDLEEIPLQQFAGNHALSPGNAAVRLHRARKALKQQLIATCGCCADHLCRDCTCRTP